MHITILEQSVADLLAYTDVPMAFTVERYLQVEPIQGGLGGFHLTERPVKQKWVKDYDQPEPALTRWLEWGWDLSKWGIFGAFDGDKRVGGAIAAWNTPEMHMLKERLDLAVLSDIRVQPDFRRRGIGAALLEAAEAWALGRNCRMLEIETQNINVPACRFYAHMGYTLGSINRFAYPEWPDGVQLLWHKRL